MNAFIKSCLASFLFLISFAAFAASPIGYWKTIDDVTGRPKGIVKISGSPSNLHATVVKIFPGGLTVCTACHGSLKNKPIMGMTVMSGLKQEANNSNTWSGGRILDPKNGKEYNCKLTVSDDGSRLDVRGFMGISLFGRTQTWVRVSGT